ncbi:MAG: TusE/DsrC/DsvC family sulfur relay protein [Thiothrix sp.]|nr:TusE/DsrC/DsvC family sulfur relay protein [Thiothrix sp.]HPE60507.1 TusE/DsrC/DsvC family sulfur relay protein [Thiolinea sp.]
MLGQATIDEMFPRALPVFRPPLPTLKTRATYAGIRRRAAAMQLTLTEAHMEVIDFVLDFYETCDDCENARALSDMMKQEFLIQGGRRYLYQLFPEGPLSTIHELADLPDLGHQSDAGAGTRY